MANDLPTTLAERTFDAVILDWDAFARAARRSEEHVLGSLVEELCGAGVHVIVVSEAPAAAVDEQLRARPVGPGVLHLCADGGARAYAVTAAGVSLVWPPDTDAHADDTGAPAGDAALQWVVTWLADQGISGELILATGRAFGRSRVAALRRAVVVSVGATSLVDLLTVQLERRRDRRVPSIDDDRSWVVRLPTEAALARARESMGTLANGWAGTRGAAEEDGAATLPLFVVNGVYAGDERSSLLAGPTWTCLEVAGEPARGAWLLDLHSGVLLRTPTGGSGIRSLRFASLARPHALALRAEARPGQQLAPGHISSPTAHEQADRETRAPADQVVTAHWPGCGQITVAAQDWQGSCERAHVVERVAGWAASADGTSTEEQARAWRADALDAGFDQLLTEHRAAWAQRWADAGVSIVGAPDDELAARFAVFHLLAAAPDRGEAALGARGLTGAAYGGHVFWDADVFVLPALAALRPQAARAMVEYRLRRLDAARAAARAQGDEGARFPWESALMGVDVTPERVRGAHGELIAIRTGEHEEHVVADVAWAVDEYVRWSGDRRLLADSGHKLIVETARYWASRIRMESGGTGHLYGVIGPDEYHEIVDDNAFTNVMARWNLRRAADLCDGRTDVAAEEVARWRQLAVALVDGYDHGRGLYEQFAGYWDLEPLLVTELTRPPVAADVLLGPERVAATQIIKQADVLMLHHLVPDEVVPGSLEPNLAYYDPRTAHGSSLSPAISAALFARAGQPDRALELFRIAARLDLDDITGTTAGGLHLATMGGVWQALAYGFLGLRPTCRSLHVEPRLPAAWNAVDLRFQLHRQVIGVTADHATVRVACSRPLGVRVGGAPIQRCEPPGATYELQGGPS